MSQLVASEGITLKERAVWLHELYCSLLDAGFDVETALELIEQRLPEFPEEV